MTNTVTDALSRCDICYEYHLYSSGGQGPEYIHVQEGRIYKEPPGEIQ
jgi:hypothetical protein